MPNLWERLAAAPVEWRTLGEMFHIKNGYTPSKRVKSYWQDGTVPWFRMEDIREHGHLLDDAIQKVHSDGVKGELFPANSIIMATTATIGVHALVSVDYLANQRFTNFALKPEYADAIDMKYIYYYFYLIDDWAKRNVNASSFASVKMEELKSYRVPVPPLDVQREIVRILDTFTALTTELQTERAQRMQQYEYYRDMLLSEGYLNVLIAKELQAGRRLNRVRLGDVGIFTRGNGLQKKDFRTDGHPVIHYGQIYTSYGFAAQNAISYVSDAVFTRLRKARTGALLIATTSENIEDVAKCVVWEGSKEVGFSGDMYSFQTTENPRYLAYFFQTNDFQRQKEKKVTGTKVNRIHGDDLAQIELLLPPPDIQQEVVRVLDKFQEYVAEVDGLLPQEIAQRQKQYAYYREKLLTFDMESAKHTHE